MSKRPPSSGQGLDFAATRRLASRWALLVLALAVLALAALAWQGQAAWRQQQRLQALQDDLARVQTQQARLRGQGPAPLPPAVLADARAAAQALAMPWGALLAHLARHGTPEVALTQLEPDARSGNLLLAGQATSPEAALAYARHLGEGTVLRQVQLLGHEPLPAGGGTQFRLSARWTGDAPAAADAAADAASAPAEGRP